LVSQKKLLIREAAFICNIGYENAKILSRDFKKNKFSIKKIKKVEKHQKKSNSKKLNVINSSVKMKKTCATQREHQDSLQNIFGSKPELESE